MATDFANKLDDAADGIVEFVVRLMRTAYYVVFRWKRLIDEMPTEPRTTIVGPRVFLVASVLIGGLVAELDAAFWSAEGLQKLRELARFFTELANVRLMDALVRSAPFFIVAMLASTVIRSLEPENRPLRDVIHYAMAGICLTFFPTLFLAAFLFSYVLDELLNTLFNMSLGGLLIIPALVLTLLGVFVMRLRYGTQRVLEGVAGNASGSHNGFRLVCVYGFVLLATIVLLIFLLPDPASATPPAE